MKKENITTIIALGIVVIILVSGIILVKNASGVNPPFTVIESNSMQHSEEKSQIGIIDTGDMIMVRSFEKSNVVSYVEGYQTGHQEFGDYGSVLIYKRPVGNPVIHRAILWMEYDGLKWSAPSLEHFNDSNGNPLWECDSNDYMNITGTLKLTLNNGYRNIIAEINVTGSETNYLQLHSGYVTMGDNNGVVDQSASNISLNNLVNPERIKSVAWKEIPWLGSLKLLANGHTSYLNNYATNSVPCLAALFVTIILSVVSVGYLFDEFVSKKKKTPTP